MDRRWTDQQKQWEQRALSTLEIKQMTNTQAPRQQEKTSRYKYKVSERSFWLNKEHYLQTVMPTPLT